MSRAFARKRRKGIEGRLASHPLHVRIGLDAGPEARRNPNSNSP